VRAFLIPMALVLGGCSTHSSGYTRTDGVSVDPLHEQATLAQCKGEGATAPVQSTPGSPMEWLSESERKLLLSMPAWRGMVTFRRSSEQGDNPRSKSYH
jgi:hypothetical protein